MSLKTKLPNELIFQLGFRDFNLLSVNEKIKELDYCLWRVGCMIDDELDEYEPDKSVLRNLRRQKKELSELYKNCILEAKENDI